MRASSAVLLEILRVQLWVVPAIAALLAAAFAVLLAGFDSATGSLGLPLDIDADSARAVLSAISGAMISFTALVFSVTMLVLQTASTQLSPRVVRTFLRDRFNQVVMGLFVATFVFSLLMSTAVSEAHVPQLGVLAAVGLVLVAVMAFVVYIDHMAHDIRPTSVIESITDETRAVIERVYPEGAAGRAGGTEHDGLGVGCRRPRGDLVRTSRVCAGLRPEGLAGLRRRARWGSRAAHGYRRVPRDRPAPADRSGTAGA